MFCSHVCLVKNFDDCRLIVVFVVCRKKKNRKEKNCHKKFPLEKILSEEKIDWKKKIRETSDIRKVKNESNFRGGITKKRMG